MLASKPHKKTSTSWKSPKRLVHKRMSALFTMFLFTLACGTSSSDAEPTDALAAQKPTTITVYSGRGESLVAKLFEQIPADAPFRVEVQYGKTAEMVTRMVTEGEQSPADVIFVQDSGHLGALAARDALASSRVDCDSNRSATETRTGG